MHARTLLGTARFLASLLGAAALLLSPQAAAQPYSQVVTGLAPTSANVNGITVTVASVLGNTLTPCGTTAPYWLPATGGSYTFTFSKPVGAVRVPVVFGAGSAGTAHFTVNGSPYPLTAANLAGAAGTCAGGLAVVSGGDLVNTSDIAFNANNTVLIPGPVTSITVASTSAAAVSFGVFFAADSYFQVLNTTGVSARDGVNTTVTSAGSAGSTNVCGTFAQPYAMIANGGTFNFAFAAGTVTGVNMPVIFNPAGIFGAPAAGSFHVSVNGVGVTLGAANLVGAVPSSCPGALATIAGGNLTNNGNTAANTNGMLQVPGPMTTLSINSASTTGVLSGLYITTGSANTALAFSNPGTQSLLVAQDAANPINALLAARDANNGVPTSWSVAIAPQHGTLGGFPLSGVATGSAVTPAGLTYTPTAGYTGPDGFAIEFSDGVNRAATVVNVTVIAPPNPSNLALSVPPNFQFTRPLATVTSSTLVDGTYTVTYSLTGANPGSGLTAPLVMAGGTGTFRVVALAGVGTTTLTATSFTNAANASTAAPANSAIFTTRTAHEYSQVSNLSGSSNVNGVAVSVTSSGNASTAVACGPEPSPYLLNASPASYTFTFSPPAGSLRIPVVFAAGGTAGTAHFAVNGGAYTLTSAHLAGQANSACTPGLAVLSGGDLANTGSLNGDPSNVVVIPGPVSSITVSSTGFDGFLFGMYVAANNYARVPITSGGAFIGGNVSVAVSSSGAVTTGALCGQGPAPYLLTGGAGQYTFSFIPAVSGVNVPAVFGANSTGTVRISANGVPVSLVAGNVTQQDVSGMFSPNGCFDGIVAAPSGGDLGPAGDPVDPSAVVRVPGPITTLTVTNQGSTGVLHGVLAATTVPALEFSLPGTQALSLLPNAAATPLNSLLAVAADNVALDLRWSVVIAPQHGTLGGFPFTVTNSAGGVNTPSGLTYTPTPGYSGSDGFAVEVWDGFNKATVAVNVAIASLSQSINFTNPGTHQVSITPFALAAAATSGLAVTFTSATPATCSVSGTSATALAPGTCTINADQGGNATYAPAPQVQQSIQVTLNPSITNAAATTFTVNAAGTFTVTAVGSPTPTLSLTGALPAGVTFTPATGVLAGTPALGTVGVYPVTIGAANGVLPNASQPFALTVARSTQTIAFANPGAQTLAIAPPSLTATATSGLTVAFTSATMSVCTVSGTSLTLLAAGTCTVNADQAGNANYNAAPQVQQSFQVILAPSITSAAATTFIVNAAGMFTVTATGAPTPTFSLIGALPAGVTFTAATGALAGTPVLGTVGVYPVTIGAVNGGLPNASQPFTLSVAKSAQTIAFANPGAQSATNATLALTATATSGLTVAFTSATTSVCTVSGASLTMLAAGTCTVSADQAGDANYNAAPQVQQSFPVTLANPPRLSNISTRMQVLGGNDRMIAGFVIGGVTPKTVVINVAGPNLVQYGITNALMNPTLTLVRASDQSVLKTNDDWQTQAIGGDLAALQGSGFQPNNAAEPAVIATLDPGAYTAIVEGVGGTTGVGLVGVFEVDHPEIPLVNISTRGQVLLGNDVMIAGFIIQGSNSKSVVINVAGPNLVQYGIANALMNPTLTVVRASDQTIIATNDDWQTQTNPADVAAIQATGFQPNNAAEPAVILTLQPGAYTAIVQGAGGGTGVGLVGVFAVP